MGKRLTEEVNDRVLPKKSAYCSKFLRSISSLMIHKVFFTVYFSTITNGCLKMPEYGLIAQLVRAHA